MTDSRQMLRKKNATIREMEYILADALILIKRHLSDFDIEDLEHYKSLIQDIFDSADDIVG